MKALGLAADMSYARNWVGKVDWYIDNMGVINNYRRIMHRWVANDWSKAGDRDVNGYINVLRRRVKGEWAVHHQLGHVCGEAQEVQVERPLDDDRVGQLGR